MIGISMNDENIKDMGADSKDSTMVRLKNVVVDTHTPLPEIPKFPIPGDPLDNFVNKLEGFDGRAMIFESRQDAIKWLKNEISGNQFYTEAMQEKGFEEKIPNVYSSVTDIEGNVSEDMVSDPHNAHIVDCCVTEAILGVGETGSLLVTDSTLHNSSCALLCKHLYVLIAKSKILAGLQEAYAEINLRDNQYGCFFTGPSATADIEAVHITGAQGPLSLTALLY